jgi:hypothetical protein
MEGCFFQLTQRNKENVVLPQKTGDRVKPLKNENRRMKYEKYFLLDIFFSSPLYTPMTIHTL